MDFYIVSDTAGAKVAELADELMEILEEPINSLYEEVDAEIGIAIRCLPESYNRKSFVRFLKKDNDLTIDLSVSLEEYQKMYKIEQRFHLGNSLLALISKGLSRKDIFPNLDKTDFLNSIKSLGKENGWFTDEIDYSLDLDQ